MICVTRKARSGPCAEELFRTTFRTAYVSGCEKESKREVGNYHFDLFSGFEHGTEKRNYFFVTGG
jgi:hypothetical protein